MRAQSLTAHRDDDAYRLHDAWRTHIDRNIDSIEYLNKADFRAAAAEFSRPYRERIAELEAEHALSWNAFEKEALDAIGADVVGMTIDAGANIPGMIQRLHERYRAEIQREQTRRIEAEAQRDTYKRLANMKRTTKRDA